MLFNFLLGSKPDQFKEAAQSVRDVGSLSISIWLVLFLRWLKRGGFSPDTPELAADLVSLSVRG